MLIIVAAACSFPESIRCLRIMPRPV